MPPVTSWCYRTIAFFPVDPSEASNSSVVSGTPLFAECGNAFREMKARAHAISKLLFQRLPARCVIGNAGTDLRLYRLDRRWAVRRDLNGSLDGSGHDISSWQHAINER